MHKYIYVHTVKRCFVIIPPPLSLPPVLEEAECSSDNVCSQNCVLLESVVTCGCDAGYQLAPDNVTCLGKPTH